MKELELMNSEAKRISKSIAKIDNFHQVASTIRWIRIFESRFKAYNVGANLLGELQNVQL